jgi:ABC-type spermidine/putrescine transport system permease subunit II
MIWMLATPVVVFLVAPVIIVVVVSFSGSEYLRFPPPTLSLRWHERFWTTRGWRQAALVSLQFSAVAALIATSFGVAAALALSRWRARGRGVLYALLLSPMIVPTLITAIGYYYVATRMKLVGTIVGVALGEALLALPIVVIMVSATLQSFDRRLEQAALGLGASAWYTFRRVTLPLIAPGVVAASLFAFLAAFDDLLIPLFLGGVRLEALTARIWSGLQVELDTTIAAVSTLFIAITTGVLGLSALLVTGRAP